MNINIYKQEEGSKFYVTFTDEESWHGSGFSFTCNRDELKDLNEKISIVLKEDEETKPEMVWNPRSQRHELVKK